MTLSAVSLPPSGVAPVMAGNILFPVLPSPSCQRPRYTGPQTGKTVTSIDNKEATAVRCITSPRALIVPDVFRGDVIGHEGNTHGDARRNSSSSTA